MKQTDQSDHEDDDDAEGVNGLTRRFGWNVEDDRFILESYVKYTLLLPICNMPPFLKPIVHDETLSTCWIQASKK